MVTDATRNRNFDLSAKSLPSSSIYEPTQLLSPSVNFLRDKNIFTWRERLEPKESRGGMTCYGEGLPEEVRARILKMVEEDKDAILARLGSVVSKEDSTVKI